MSTAEEWRPIAYADGYEVSNLGRVRSWRLGGMYAASRRRAAKVLVPSLSHNGYEQVSVGTAGTRLNRRVSRLVLESFVGPCPAGMECCHNNGDRRDNRLSNLRWDTVVNNHRDMAVHGTQARGATHGAYTKPERVRRGVNINTAKLTPDLVREIRSRWPGESIARLASQYGMSTWPIQCVVKRKSWTHVE